MLINACSLGNKLSELHYTLYACNLSIVLIVESWLDATFTRGLLDPESRFHIVRNDRNRNGGGVCAFIRNDITVNNIPIDNRFPDVELLCFDILSLCHITRVFLAYRPPGNTADDINYLGQLIDCLGCYLNPKCRNIIAGDFNLPKIDWVSLTSPADTINKSFLHFVINSGLTQVVNCTTRLSNVLDIILVDDAECIVSVTNAPPFSSSDHQSVMFYLLVDGIYDSNNNNSTDGEMLKMWNKADFTSFENYLYSIDWYALIVYLPSSADMWAAFVDVLNQGISMFVPVKCIAPVKRDSHARYPKPVRKDYRAKQSVWKQYKAHRFDTDLRVKYRECVQNCRQTLKDHHRHAEQELIDKNSVGSFYSFVNKRIANRSRIGPLTGSDGKLILMTYKRPLCLTTFSEPLAQLMMELFR